MKCKMTDAEAVRKILLDATDDELVGHRIAPRILRCLSDRGWTQPKKVPRRSAVCPDPEAHEKGDLLLPCDHAPQVRIKP